MLAGLCALDRIVSSQIFRNHSQSKVWMSSDFWENRLWSFMALRCSGTCFIIFTVRFIDKSMQKSDSSSQKTLVYKFRARSNGEVWKYLYFHLRSNYLIYFKNTHYDLSEITLMIIVIDITAIVPPRWHAGETFALNKYEFPSNKPPKLSIHPKCQMSIRKIRLLG